MAACVVQVFIEIALFETMECLWINFFIPSLVVEEVQQASAALREVAASLCSSERHDTKYILNAPDYLFISTQVARAFPTLMESTIVRSFHTHLPGQLSLKWSMGSVERIKQHNVLLRAVPLMTTLLFTFQYMATAPFILQRMFIRFIQPFFLTGLFQLVLYLSAKTIVGSVTISVVVHVVACLIGWRLFSSRSSSAYQLPGRCSRSQGKHLTARLCTRCGSSRKLARRWPCLFGLRWSPGSWHG